MFPNSFFFFLRAVPQNNLMLSISCILICIYGRQEINFAKHIVLICIKLTNLGVS